MAHIKLSSQVDESARRIRPEVVRHLEDSMAENERLGRLLAK